MLEIFPTPLFSWEWWGTVILVALWALIISDLISRAIGEGILRGHKRVEEYKREQAKKDAEVTKP